MTKQEIETILSLRRQGVGYKKLAAGTGISINTIKSYCRLHPISDDSATGCISVDVNHCQFCGAEITQTPHRKEKRFCSDQCRNNWWKAHPEKRASKKSYPHLCAFCSREFFSDRAGSRYCSTQCFANARRKESRA